MNRTILIAAIALLASIAAACTCRPRLLEMLVTTEYLTHGGGGAGSCMTGSLIFGRERESLSHQRLAMSVMRRTVRLTETASEIYYAQQHYGSS
jgi:hypothetical protein